MGMRMMWLVAALFMATTLHVNVSAQKGYDTFNKALVAEKTSSDLRAAIRLYEQTIREAGNDRPLAARALLRLGDCYRRLGDAQAQTAFARIIKDYAEQADVVAEARARLEPVAEAPSAARLAVSLEGSIVFDGLISPDGRVPGTDWSTGDVVFVDVLTRSVTRIVQGVSPNWGENPVLSPDSKQVAYQWFDDKDGETLHQLRLISTERGAKPRVLVDDSARVHNVYPIAWSPDGRRLLVQYEIPAPAGSSQPRGQGDFQLAWLATDSGTMTNIKRFEWWRSAGGNSLGLVSVSPDGRYLAYSAAPSQGSSDRAIYVMSIDGSATAEVATGGLNQSPVWTPDGRQLLFVSDRSGSFGVWSTRVQNGKSIAFVTAVKPSTGQVRLHGFAKTGLLYYSAHTRLDEIFVAPISRDGRLASGVLPTESTPGDNAVWSPDGQFLAFKRRVTDGRYDLVVRNMQTGKELKWSGSTGTGRPLNNALMFWTGNTRVMADGRTPIEVVGDELRRAADVAVPRGSLARDGSVLYASAGESEARVNQIDPLTGAVKRSFAIPRPVPFVALSPSGDTLALISTRGVAVVSVDGSNYRDVYVVPAGGSTLAATARWAGDGRAILVTANEPKQLRMMRIPIEGGQPEPGGLVGLTALRFDISPDGTRISYGNRRESIEVWSLQPTAVLKN